MIAYELVTAFADQAFAGSPLAVVLGSGGIEDAVLHAIAGELGAPETAFVLPPTNPRADYRVRVFTRSGASPHGGHCAVGTAVTLVRRGAVPAGTLVQECGTAVQSVTATGECGTLHAAGGAVHRSLDPAPLVTATGLRGRDVVGGLAGQAGFGGVFHYLLVSEAALGRARLDPDALQAAGARDVSLVAWDARRRQARVRLFAPGYDLPEDPACGPVALGLGAWLAGAGLLEDGAGRHEFVIEQGVELGRPARLRCAVTRTADGACGASVTGAVRRVAHGALVDLPPAATPSPQRSHEVAGRPR